MQNLPWLALCSLLVVVGSEATHLSHVSTMRDTAPPQAVALEPAEDAAARAAVIVLRAIAEPMDSTRALVDRVQILPGSSIITDHEAAVLLANMAKPVRCNAKSIGRILQVACSALPADDAWMVSAKIRARDEDARSLNPSEYESFLRRGEGRIVLLGNDEYVPLDISEFERFERTYVFTGAYSVHSGPAKNFGVPETAGEWVRWYSASQSRTYVVSQ
jgi:hypothetical protein